MWSDKEGGYEDFRDYGGQLGDGFTRMRTDTGLLGHGRYDSLKRGLGGVGRCSFISSAGNGNFQR